MSGEAHSGHILSPVIFFRLFAWVQLMLLIKYAIINEPSLVQVTQLHAVWSDQGSGVAPEGVGLVDQVPEPVTIYDHGDVERHDLLEDKGDAAQHGLVLAKAWANHHAVHPGKPGVHLETSGGLDFNF